MLTFYKIMGLLILVSTAFFVVPSLVSYPDTFAVGLGIFLGLFVYPGVVAGYVKFMFFRRKKETEPKESLQ